VACLGRKNRQFEAVLDSFRIIGSTNPRSVKDALVETIRPWDSFASGFADMALRVDPISEIRRANSLSEPMVVSARRLCLR
jgi:hypothetical protein